MLIHHYCSPDAFLKIVTSGALHVCQAKFMNDPSEMYYSKQIIQDVIEKCRSKPQITSYDVDKKFDGMHHPLVASFSRQSDLLSLWRPYGSDGRGFAIGFESKCFSLQRFDNRHLPVSLAYDEVGIASVVYDVEKQKRIVRSAISKYDQKYPGELLNILRRTAYTFKHPSYFQEEEVRIIWLPTDFNPGTGSFGIAWKIACEDSSVLDAGNSSRKINRILGKKQCFRSAEMGITPFYTINLRACPSAIKIITIGPKNYSEEGTLRELLASSGLGYDCNIVTSRAPYR